MRIQQKIQRCNFDRILYFCKESPSYENNIANPSQQRIWLVAQQRHAAKHSDNTSLVTGDPSFMLVSDNIPHYHCSRCLVSPFKKRNLWKGYHAFYHAFPDLKNFVFFLLLHKSVGVFKGHVPSEFHQKFH